jgi:hypothetical protein
VCCATGSELDQRHARVMGVLQGFCRRGLLSNLTAALGTLSARTGLDQPLDLIDVQALPGPKGAILRPAQVTACTTASYVFEGLREIRNQVLYVLDTDRYADQGIRQIDLLAQLARDARMRHRGRMRDQRFGAA